MNSIRTTVTLPEVVLKHIQDSLKDGDTLKSFFERAVINQLEKEGDFEIRDLLEVQHGCEE